MKRHLRLLAVAVFLLLLLAAFQLSGLRAHLNLAFVHQTLVDHRLTGLLLFVLFFSLGNLIQLPGWLFLGAAVLALGEWQGGIATYVAACVSCMLTFALVRAVGGDALRAFRSRTVRALLARLDAHPVKSVVLLRLLLQTAPMLNYALALSGVRWRHYLIGTVLGLPVPIALYCVFFDFVAQALNLPRY